MTKKIKIGSLLLVLVAFLALTGCGAMLDELDDLLTLGTVEGVVTDATTGGPISGAQISLNGSNETTTNSSGAYTLTDVLNESTISVSKDGYTEATRTISFPEGQTSERADFSLSPVLAAGEYRIVLTWGAEPSDLDSHLLIPTSNTNPDQGFHVYHGNKGSRTSYPYTELDVDDMSSYGPETITITQRYSQTYKYYVHNYSGLPAITDSDALVQIYNENGLIREYHVPATGNGYYWHVFDISSSGSIITQNVIQSEAPTL